MHLTRSALSNTIKALKYPKLFTLASIVYLQKLQYTNVHTSYAANLHTWWLHSPVSSRNIFTQRKGSLNHSIPGNGFNLLKTPKLMKPNRSK